MNKNISNGSPMQVRTPTFSFEVQDAIHYTTEIYWSQCLKTQKEDKKIADGWNVDFLYYYDIF